MIVEHQLLLPANNEKGFATQSIVSFSSSDDRVLDEARMHEVALRLKSDWQPPDTPPDHRPQSEMADRLFKYLQEWLYAHPAGSRLLVFMPGRTQAQNEASRLEGGILQNEMLRKRLEAYPCSLEASLKEAIGSIEDPRLGKRLAACVRQGIIIHHADVSRTARTAIEAACNLRSANERSQILFATETLSYGVNLAVDEVVLFGVEFYTQTRMGKQEREPLTVSAFHNMCGRAGRLGKIQGRGMVTILVPEKASPMDVVKRYYSTIRPLVSRIYVKDDRQAQKRFEKLKQLSTAPGRLVSHEPAPVGAKDLSYPFTRSVLDALRHLNWSRRTGINSDVEEAVFCSLADIRVFFTFSLYHKERAEDDRIIGRVASEYGMFQDALLLTLKSCAREPLLLIQEASGRDGEESFAITPRGQAIIDTGTEIRTVAPLLEDVKVFQTLWLEVEKTPDNFPAELYFLCLICQEEVHKHVIRTLPECRNPELQSKWITYQVEFNSRDLRKQFEEILVGLHIANVDTLCDAIYEAVEKSTAEAVSSGNYQGAGRDAVIRLFLCLIKWIHDAQYEEIVALFEGHGLMDSLRGSLQRWRQFTEALSWKILCLARMLRTSTSALVKFDFESERNLYLLASRVRWGCNQTMIPLFSTQRTEANRQNSVDLVKHDLTPADLVLQTFDRLAAKGVKLNRPRWETLRDGLLHLAASRLERLCEELSFRPPSGASANEIVIAWVKKLYSDSEKRRREKAGIDTGKAIQILVAKLRAVQEQTVNDENSKFLFQVDTKIEHGLVERGHARVALVSRRPGQLTLDFLVAGEAPEGEDQKNLKFRHRRSVELNIVTNAEFWKKVAAYASSGVGASDEWTVLFPWPSIPSELSEMNSLAQTDRRTIFSPAAFLLAIHCLTRQFVSGEKLYEIVKKQSQLHNYIYISNLFNAFALAGISLPAQLREAVLSHFEIQG